jgi:hypothetical protein
MWSSSKHPSVLMIATWSFLRSNDFKTGDGFIQYQITLTKATSRIEFFATMAGCLNLRRQEWYRMMYDYDVVG